MHRTKEVACAGRTRLSYLALIYYSIFNVFTNTSQAQGQAPGQDSACSGLPDYLLESTSGTVKRVAHSRRSVQFRVIDPRRLHLAVDSFPCRDCGQWTSCRHCDCEPFSKTILPGPITNLRVFIGFCGRCWMRIEERWWAKLLSSSDAGIHWPMSFVGAPLRATNYYCRRNQKLQPHNHSASLSGSTH